MTLFKKTLATTQMDADGNQNARRGRRRRGRDGDVVPFGLDEDTATTVEFRGEVEDDRNPGDPDSTRMCSIKW